MQWGRLVVVSIENPSKDGAEWSSQPQVAGLDPGVFEDTRAEFYFLNFISKIFKISYLFESERART